MRLLEAVQNLDKAQVRQWATVGLSFFIGCGVTSLALVPTGIHDSEQNDRFRANMAEVENRMQQLEASLDQLSNYTELLNGRLAANVVSIRDFLGQNSPEADTSLGEVSVGDSFQPAKLAFGEAGDWALGQSSSLERRVQQRMNTVKRKTAGLTARLTRLGDAVHDKNRLLQRLPSQLPANGRLTSGFGQRLSPFSGKPAQHNGIDIAAKSGSEIRAPADGHVTHSAPLEDFGKSVTLRHDFGIISRYAHAKEVYVDKGDYVEKGQTIARVGNTGKSTGPHLHFEIWKGREPMNPLRFFETIQTGQTIAVAKDQPTPGDAGHMGGDASASAAKPPFDSAIAAGATSEFPAFRYIVFLGLLTLGGGMLVSGLRWHRNPA